MDRTPNANKLWEPSEHETLNQMWHTGATLEDMAMALGRSGSGIVAQLAALGHIYFSNQKMAYFRNEAMWTIKQVQVVDRKMKESRDE